MIDFITQMSVPPVIQVLGFNLRLQMDSVFKYQLGFIFNSMESMVNWWIQHMRHKSKGQKQNETN